MERWRDQDKAQAGHAYLNIARPAIKRHLQTDNLAVLSKKLLQIFFAGLFMDVGDGDDPAFDTADGDGAGGGARF